MKQLMQKLRDGSMEVLEAALPVMGSGMVMVQNHFSLISAGTEGGTVTAARKSLIGKAKERPEQVKQVIESLKQQGAVQTYRAVSKKLDSYSPLGYSSAGIALDVGPDVKGIAVGDKVACAGMGYAAHAEIVAVPGNLCVKLPADADLERAAYNTLGAIALQGVRQADLRLGETCVVIGLGLLGQLTCLMLKASGIKVFGLDISSKAVATALRHCVDSAYEIADPTIGDTVHHATRGINADAVIITAATHSTQPINLAGRLLRKRGTVVVVGDVPTGFEREPDYYRKELSLKMSCSYGPGRYDLTYEEKGLDYPAGYVRWTENRNMQAFQDLVHSEKINLDYMTTHRFPIDDAPAAYDLILSKTEDYLGIVIEYDARKSHSRGPVMLRQDRSARMQGANGIGFIGAGSYAMSHLLPNLPRDGSVTLTGVMTSSGTSSRSVAEKYGFGFAAASHDEVINDKGTGSVFIATRHDTHAGYVQEALKAGKNVFVEKPLCRTPNELIGVINAWKEHQPLLTIGFNRRFSPLATQAKAILDNGPMSMVYRVNAGAIPQDSWIQDTDIGGGRIVGEVCHFVDFLTFMNGSIPKRVFACTMQDPLNLKDTVSINLVFENGSIGSICYFANGPKSLPKEYIEIYKGGMAARLLDFKQLEILGGRKPIRKRLMSQDKGQKAMVEAVLSTIKNGGANPIPLPDSLACTMATFSVMESIRMGKAIDLPELSLS
jgi:predicted dehydrogenase/threonine dehydrogenase-like Zn-dependent dehydrogenase